jgi:hypothetical protein
LESKRGGTAIFNKIFWDLDTGSGPGFPFLLFPLAALNRRADWLTDDRQIKILGQTNPHAALFENKTGAGKSSPRLENPDDGR